MKYITSVGVFIAIVLLIFVLFRKPHQIFKTSPVKVLEKEIVIQKEAVEKTREKVEITKKELLYYKTVNDTINIIRYQDSVIIYQDTQIVQLTQVVQLQDTVITKLKFDNKRLKRQRNLMILATGAAVTTLILK